MVSFFTGLISSCICLPPLFKYPRSPASGDGCFSFQAQSHYLWQRGYPVRGLSDENTCQAPRFQVRCSQSVNRRHNVSRYMDSKMCGWKAALERPELGGFGASVLSRKVQCPGLQVAESPQHRWARLTVTFSITEPEISPLTLAAADRWRLCRSSSRFLCGSDIKSHYSAIFL